MDSLSNRLKKLGIQVGAQELKPPSPTFPIDEVVPGEWVATPLGESYRVVSRFPLGTYHGKFALRHAPRLQAVSSWAGYPDLTALAPESFTFLDTETTGLAGGAGTLVFLVGAARFEGGELVVTQFFLRDPGEEAAMLEAIEGFLHPVECLVTFNGKSFDLPLLQNRFITNGWESPWTPSSHLDLLHLARRLWKDRLPSRALGDLETQLLGVRRTEEEVPGWLVPLIYVDYLRARDARPLKGVFYHNLTDVLSMVVLLDLCAGMLESGVSSQETDPVDLISMAKMWEDTGELERAIQLYESGLGRDLPDGVYLKAVRQLSFIRKREGDYSTALDLWRIAAGGGEIYACVELAKFHEHNARDYDEAMTWTRLALELVEASELPPPKRENWKTELDWRAQRLQRKRGGL